MLLRRSFRSLATLRSTTRHMASGGGGGTHEVRVDQELKLVRFEPTQEATAVVLFAHGLGDTAAGWADAIQMIAPSLPHVRFILPTASSIPVSLNMGMSMPAWYDLHADGRDRALEPCEGLDASAATVRGLLRAEHEGGNGGGGIAYNRMVLGGFSQGGALSLWTGLQMGLGGDEGGGGALAGVLCMSGYLPRSGTFAPCAATAAAAVPTLMCHGDADPMVQLKWAEASRDKLRQQGLEVEFAAFPGMEHSACEEELQLVARWLGERLPAQQDEAPPSGL